MSESEPPVGPATFPPIIFRIYRPATSPRGYKGDVVETKTLAQEIIKVGKLPSSDLRLEDDNVSRMHAVIETVSPGETFIIDLGSAAGTIVNGKKEVKCRLKDGDQLLLGGTRVTVEMRGDDIEVRKQASATSVEEEPLRLLAGVEMGDKPCARCGHPQRDHLRGVTSCWANARSFGDVDSRPCQCTSFAYPGKFESHRTESRDEAPLTAADVAREIESFHGAHGRPPGVEEIASIIQRAQLRLFKELREDAAIDAHAATAPRPARPATPVPAAPAPEDQIVAAINRVGDILEGILTSIKTMQGRDPVVVEAAIDGVRPVAEEKRCVADERGVADASCVTEVTRDRLLELSEGRVVRVVQTPTKVTADGREVRPQERPCPAIKIQYWIDGDGEGDEPSYTFSEYVLFDHSTGVADMSQTVLKRLPPQAVHITRRSGAVGRVDGL